MSDLSAAYGLPIDALDPTWQPLEVAVVAKCLDGDGVVRLITTYSTGLNAWEAIGMLDLAHAAELSRVVDLFNQPNEDGT